MLIIIADLISRQRVVAEIVPHCLKIFVFPKLEGFWLETRRFKRGKSNRRLRPGTLPNSRVPALSGDSESQGQDRSRLPVDFCPLLMLCRVLCGSDNRLRGQFKGAWTNVWPQDQLHSMVVCIFRVLNLDSCIKKQEEMGMFRRQIRMKLSTLMIYEEKRIFVEIGTQM